MHDRERRAAALQVECRRIEDVCTTFRDGVAFLTHVPERNCAASAIALQQSLSNDLPMILTRGEEREDARRRSAAMHRLRHSRGLDVDLPHGRERRKERGETKGCKQSDQEKTRAHSSSVK